MFSTSNQAVGDEVPAGFVGGGLDAVQAAAIGVVQGIGCNIPRLAIGKAAGRNHLESPRTSIEYYWLEAIPEESTQA